MPSKRVADIMADISAASRDQSAGIEQVSLAVSQMDEVTQQNAALVEEAAAAAEPGGTGHGPGPGRVGLPGRGGRRRRGSSKRRGRRGKAQAERQADAWAGARRRRCRRRWTTNGKSFDRPPSAFERRGYGWNKPGKLANKFLGLGLVVAIAVIVPHRAAAQGYHDRIADTGGNGPGRGTARCA